MPARTFDWRDDPMGTVVAVPEVRARFIRTEPGAPKGTFHTHEESGGWEAWVVLEGAVLFEFDDGHGHIDSVVATAGQAVYATPHERHRSPTHTHYDADGQRMPTVPGVTHPTWRGELAAGVPREA